MRSVLALAVACSLATVPAGADDIDPAVSAALQGWSLPVPSAGSLIFRHGYNCNFRTQIGLSGADHTRFAALMEPGRASADAERRADKSRVERMSAAWFWAVYRSTMAKQ
jgi:hypothetical protein